MLSRRVAARNNEWNDCTTEPARIVVKSLGVMTRRITDLGLEFRKPLNLLIIKGLNDV